MSRPVILVQYSNQFSDLLPAVMERLSAQGFDGVLLHQGASFLPKPGRSQFRLEDFVAVHDLEAVLKPRSISELGTAADVARRAGELSKAAGIKTLEVVRADRHLGRGFVTGAAYAGSRYGHSVSFDQSIDIVTRLGWMLLDLCSRYPVVAIIASPASLIGNTLLDCAEHLRIPVRIPNLSPAGHFYWAVDKYFTPFGLAEKYQSALSEKPSEHRLHNDEMSSGLHAGNRSVRAEEWINSFRSMTTPGFLLSKIYRLFRREVGNHVKRRGRVYGGYLFSEAVSQTFRVWQARRAILREKPVLAGLPADLPFVFYPLSVEPESTLMAESPTCDNQMTIIDQLAKALPGGWRLVVKEHPGLVAPRPTGFWEQIQRYPNVIKAGALESGEAYLSRARAVAIIRSTMGMQAARAGIPVLTPHPDYFGLQLPHVFLARNYQEIESSLAEIMANKLPSKPDCARLADTLASVFELGPKITDKSLLKGVADGKPISADFADTIVGDLVGSLKV